MTTPRQAELEAVVEAICPFIRWGDEGGDWPDLDQAQERFACRKNCPPERGCRAVAERAARAALHDLLASIAETQAQEPGR